MKAQTALAIWILIAGGAMAQAQTGIWMGVGPAPRSGVVKNAPFSADLISTNDTSGASQPGLKTEFHGKVARNSQGSSYFEMEHLLPVADAPRPVRITITDPAAQTVTTLDPQQKTASVGHTTLQGAGVLLTPAGASSQGSNQPRATSTSSGVPATSSSAAVAAVSTTDSKVEQLGTKTMDGLEVVGVRTTHTTQATGAQTKPFVMTIETWTSPELKVVVLTETKSSNGDRHVTKLANVVQTEPSASLFQVPAGYKISDNRPLASNAQ